MNPGLAAVSLIASLICVTASSKSFDACVTTAGNWGALLVATDFTALAAADGELLVATAGTAAAAAAPSMMPPLLEEDILDFYRRQQRNIGRGFIDAVSRKRRKKWG